MIVQWCLKGIALDSDIDARRVIDSGEGILCNWWRSVEWISPPEARNRLTDHELDHHLHHYDRIDPGTGQTFGSNTPFISLTAGTVERDRAMQTNYIRRALNTALWFGSASNTRDHAYVYRCWVLVAPRPAVGVEGVAEEVRDLNVYTRYSPHQLEGEITAKVQVQQTQIQSCEKWVRDSSQWQFDWVHDNRDFIPPSQLSNVRDLIS